MSRCGQKNRKKAVEIVVVQCGMRITLLIALLVLSACKPELNLTEPIVVPDSELGHADTTERLLDLFQEVTKGVTTDDAKVTKLVSYLQRHIYHPLHAPLDNDGQAVYDPIWILENKLGQCGQTNRVLVDILLAAGYEARVIQLHNHVAAEVYYNGDWHYLDADAMSDGDEIRDSSGDIPSAMEIHTNPSMAAHIDTLREYDFYPVQLPMPSLIYIDVFRDAPYAWVKTATPEQLNNKYYGWNYYRKETISPTLAQTD